MGKVLVTGGLGFIGSHTSVELLEEGYDVVIIDNMSNSRIEALEGIEKITGKKPDFERIDLIDAKATKRCFEKHNVDSIIHFAASKAVGESVEKPLLYYRNNLVPLMNLLECSREFEVPRFIFSSSCTVYGQPDRLPVTEESPVKIAESPYGNTKQICEEMIQDFIFSFEGIKAISLRYFNPTGAHESAVIGESPIGVPNNLIPLITQTAIGIREKLSVFGEDYNTHDGTCIRDYIHVVDLAKAHVCALEYLTGMKGRYDFFNIGTGKGVSVLEAIDSFERASGLELNYEIVGRRSGDVENIFAEVTKASELLKWNAERDINTMLKTAWEWQKKIL